MLYFRSLLLFLSSISLWPVDCKQTMHEKHITSRPTKRKRRRRKKNTQRNINSRNIRLKSQRHLRHTYKINKISLSLTPSVRCVYSFSANRCACVFMCILCIISGKTNAKHLETEYICIKFTMTPKWPPKQRFVSLCNCIVRKWTLSRSFAQLTQSLSLSHSLHHLTLSISSFSSSSFFSLFACRSLYILYETFSISFSIVWNLSELNAGKKKLLFDEVL